MSEHQKRVGELPAALQRLQAITNMLPTELNEDRILDTAVFEKSVLDRMDKLNQFVMFEGSAVERQLHTPAFTMIQVDRLHSTFCLPEGKLELYMAHHIARGEIEYTADTMKAPRPISTIQTIWQEQMRIWYIRHHDSVKNEDSLYYHNHERGELYPCSPDQLSNLDRLIDLMNNQSYLLQLM